MRIVFIAILILAAFTPSAFGSCYLDMDALFAQIAKGEYQQAVKEIEEMPSGQSCECADPGAPCFSIGPKGSSTFSVNDIKAQLAKVSQFEEKKLKQCSKMTETNDDYRSIKLGCYKDGLDQIKSAAANSPDETVYSFLAEKLTRRYSASLDQYFRQQKSDKIKAAKGNLQYRREVMVEKISKDICELYVQKDNMQKRLSNVGRHNKATDNDIYRKKMKIEYQIKRVDEKIEAMKMEFESVSEEVFFKYERCKKK